MIVAFSEGAKEISPPKFQKKKMLKYISQIHFLLIRFIRKKVINHCFWNCMIEIKIHKKKTKISNDFLTFKGK